MPVAEPPAAWMRLTGMAEAVPPAQTLGILDFLFAGETTHQHIRTP
jgi:hypothetical protein